MKRVRPPSRLARLRQEARLTQEQVAERLVLDQSMVSHWERGVAPVGDNYHGWLAELYGVPRAELVEAAQEARNGR